MRDVRKISRNEPCPCGSGRKYKHCCPRQHQAQAASRTPRCDEAEDVAELRDQVRELMAGAPPEEARRGARLLAQLDDMAALASRWPEIEAAERELEAHWAGYEALLADPQALRERVEHLFAEKDYDPLRFAVDEMQRALEAAGYLGPDDDRDVAVSRLLALIKQLAGEEYRQQAAMRLLVLLPEYVAAGRHLDAALIHDCACCLMEQPEESNPFLAAMLVGGLQRWSEHSRAAKERALQMLGLSEDQLRALTPEQAREWVSAQAADPARLAQLEAYYDQHPELAEQARADLEAAELGVIALLERGEAQPLLLSPEEVDPWAHLAAERIGPQLRRWAEALPKGKVRRRSADKEIQGILFQVAQEMVPAIFTRERLRQYAQDAREFARTLAATGQKQAARHVRMVTLPLELAADQAENRLLPIIACASLLAYLKAQQEALDRSAAG